MKGVSEEEIARIEGMEEWLLTEDILNAREWIEFRHLTAAGRFLAALVAAQPGSAVGSKISVS